MYFATFFCFFTLVACSFKDKEKKPRNFSVCVALVLIQDAISILSLFYLFFYWGACQMPSLSHHRAKCCEYFHPLPIRNFAGLSAVLPPCSLRPHRIRHRKHIAYIPKNLCFFINSNLKIQPLIICIPLALH